MVYGRMLPIGGVRPFSLEGGLRFWQGLPIEGLCQRQPLPFPLFRLLLLYPLLFLVGGSTMVCPGGLLFPLRAMC